MFLLHVYPRPLNERGEGVVFAYLSVHASNGKVDIRFWSYICGQSIWSLTIVHSFSKMVYLDLALG